MVETLPCPSAYQSAQKITDTQYWLNKTKFLWSSASIAPLRMMITLQCN